MTLKLGTRGSPLAMWQAHHVRDRLLAEDSALEIEIVEINTSGDEKLAQPLHMLGSEGIFTKEIEDALFEKRIDVAVHSCKDLPTDLPDGLALGAVLERVEGGDVLISKNKLKLAELPQGATIATGSLRRQAQLLHYRPDLHIVNVRGNLNTRFRKFHESDWAGMLLAEAGVVRLEMADEITERIPASLMLPAVGQGALALEIRDGDSDTRKRIAELVHKPTHVAITAERAFLHRLRGGCQVPVGALGTLRGDVLTLEGVVASLDGKRLYRGELNGQPHEAEHVGVELAERLVRQGAGEILEEIRRASGAQ